MERVVPFWPWSNYLKGRTSVIIAPNNIGITQLLSTPGSLQQNHWEKQFTYTGCKQQELRVSIKPIMQYTRKLPLGGQGCKQAGGPVLSNTVWLPILGECIWLCTRPTWLRSKAAFRIIGKSEISPVFIVRGRLNQLQCYTKCTPAIVCLK